MADGADERLVVMLEARVRDFEKSIDRAEKRATGSYTRMQRGSRTATQQMEADMNRTTSRINQALASTSTEIGSFAKAFAVGFGGGLVATAFAGLTSNINETVKGIAQIGDEAKRAGMSLQSFQEWKFVAEQNRIGIDALVDGFKELNLRADEFVVTGGGSAAEAFQRIGFGAEELKGRLKDPSELMLEIVGRLGNMEKAAQIRIADELFGGSAGERFVELLDQGEDGIRQIIDRAHETGSVMDEQMIKKAQDLDRRWNELTSTMGNWFRGLAVGAADAVQRLIGIRTELDAILEDEARARTILGNAIYDRIEEGRRLTEDQKEMLEDIARVTEMSIPGVKQMASVFLGIADTMDEVNPKLADDLYSIGKNMEKLAAQLESGKIEADEFHREMGDLIAEARTATAELEAIDGVGFSTVIGGLEVLAAQLGYVAQKGREALASMPGQVNTGTPLQGGAGANMPPTGDTTMTTSPRPQQPGVDSYGNWEEARNPSGGGKKGGGKGSDRGITSLISDLMTPIEEIEAWHQKAMEVLNGATEAQLAALGGKQEAIERLEQEHADRLAAIDQEKHDQRISEAGAFFGSLAAIAQVGGDKLAKVVRVTGAAEAFANTLVAQSQVLRDPKLGFLGKMAAYGVIGAAGANVVSSLGGSSGASGRGGATAISQPQQQSAPETPLRASLAGLGIDPAQFYQGETLIKLFSAIQEEAGNRGITWVPV